MSKLTEKDKLLAMIFGILLILPIICLLMAYPFMWMWNYAVVEAISVTKPIDFWQSFCLMMFISLFVKSNQSFNKSP